MVIVEKSSGRFLRSFWYCFRASRLNSLQCSQGKWWRLMGMRTSHGKIDSINNGGCYQLVSRLLKVSWHWIYFDHSHKYPNYLQGDYWSLFWVCTHFCCSKIFSLSPVFAASVTMYFCLSSYLVNHSFSIAYTDSLSSFLASSNAVCPLPFLYVFWMPPAISHFSIFRWQIP